MDRTLEVERVYNLGQYQSIRIKDAIGDERRVSNTIVNIPEELWLDTKFINKLRFLQLIQMEAVYFKYVALFIKHYHTGRKLDEYPEIIQELVELETNTIKELKELLGENKDEVSRDAE